MDKSKNKINCLSSSKMHQKKKITLEIAKFIDVHTASWS